jgi:DNA-binding NarL/FixJ family response regulator
LLLEGETMLKGNGCQVLQSAGAKGSADSLATRIVVVDDHPVVRQGLALLLEQEGDMAFCGEAECAGDALKVIEQCGPDIAIVDISLRDSSGIELIKDIRVRYPDVQILVLSMHDESFYAERVLRAGARGYVTKDEATDKVILAIRRVMAGDIYLSDKMSSKMLCKLVESRAAAPGMSVECLSDRELQVFELIGQGMGTRNIAQTLHLSTKTIESHRERIKKKLKLVNASELLQHAIQWVQLETGA